MKQISLIFPRYLHNDEHDQLHADIQQLIEEESPAKLGIVDQYDVYKQDRLVEKAALQVELGSAFTKSITNSDGFRDQLDYGFELLVQSYLYHWDPEVQEKARKVWRILQQYGNIRKLNYNAESSNMANRNAEIVNNYASDLAAIGSREGTQWLAKLDEANTQFSSHFGDRATESAARISGNVLDARVLVDNDFEAISKRINALVEVNGEAAYAAFIDKVNYYINYHKDTLAARKGRKKDGETN